MPLIDVDFTFAINNRTGKYVIGRELLRTLGDQVGSVYYSRIRSEHVPSGIAGKVLGRLNRYHVQACDLINSDKVRRRPGRVTLHLDPLSVATTVLRKVDIVLCHDMGPLSHAELFHNGVPDLYKNVFKRIADVGPHLVFVSASARDSYKHLFPHARPASVHVIYPPINVQKRVSEQGRYPT